MKPPIQLWLVQFLISSRDRDSWGRLNMVKGKPPLDVKIEIQREHFGGEKQTYLHSSSTKCSLSTYVSYRKPITLISNEYFICYCTSTSDNLISLHFMTILRIRRVLNSLQPIGGRV